MTSLLLNRPETPHVPVPVHGRSAHIPALTSFRFFLAIVVVFIHYKRQISDVGLDFPVDNLSNVVTGFFILSGFLLTYQYSQNGWQTKASTFWKTRFARLMPVYWFFLAIALSCLPLAYFIPNSAEWPLVIGSNILLVQGCFTAPQVYFGLIPPAYTLSTEAMFYAAFPFVMQTFNRWRLWLALSVGAMFAMPVATVFMNNHELIVYTFGPCPISRFIEFFAGCLLAKLFFKFKNNRNNALLLPILQVLSLLSFAYFVYQPFAKDAFLRVYGKDYYLFIVNRIVAIAGYGGMVWCLACQRGWLPGLLSVRPLVFLGEASYALFLLHDLIVRFIIVHKEFIPANFAELQLGIYVLLSIGLSCAAYVMVERPWRKALLTCFFDRTQIFSKSLRTLLKPLLSTAFLATVIIAFCWNFDSICCRLAESRSTRLSEVKDNVFGDCNLLKKAYVQEAKSTVQLYFKFGSRDSAGKIRFISLSALDKSGNILWTSSKLIHPPSNGIWYECFSAPSEKINKAADLALCLSDDSSALRVASGRRDWSDHRLLIGLPRRGVDE